LFAGSMVASPSDWKKRQGLMDRELVLLVG
jgi:hypothetical protein